VTAVRAAISVAAAADAGTVTDSLPHLIWTGGDVLNERHPFFSVNFIMEEHIQIEGRILTVLAGTMFRVELDNKHQVLATISGKMRKRFVRLTVGDRVKMEMSPYDLNKARIVWRLG
jgi:translation initiation factor IF-1